ncbi:hypothetical protein L6164_020098 [Bauhinia variegata]|uniref:Uncharacterized protein n=1 Tax=Bauhinia variegata TaxID=167791 RepID=A0ACB9MVB8_BAUVA|nr:hypothetical protein L6164_020098 [Bauhinia variegata]
MAGLFSLGGGGGRGSSNPEEEQHHHHQGHNPVTEIAPPESLFWYKNNEDVSSYRGFELWQQHEQLLPQAQARQFHHHPHPQQDLYSSAAALGVGPSRSSINVSDDQSSSRSGFMVMRSSGGISCQDCGNQAKKDCPHMRCRTCCKSRGFECQTHVKSTWVPAPKRRERQHQHQHQHQLAAMQQQEQQLQLGGDNSKRQRDNNPSSSALACTRLPTNPSSSEHGNLPSVLSSPADFRCVRVSSMDDPDEQYAYQTAVNIGGHVFRGILYDHGPDNNYMASEGSSGAVVGVQPLNLIAAAPSLPSGSGDAMVSSTGALVDPSSLYPAPLNTYMAGSGTQFFPHPRS